jgi:hypothetical protein
MKLWMRHPIRWARTRPIDTAPGAIVHCATGERITPETHPEEFADEWAAQLQSLVHAFAQHDGWVRFER